MTAWSDYTVAELEEIWLATRCKEAGIEIIERRTNEHGVICGAAEG